MTRERRHNQPIDIDPAGLARSRHEYDSAVRIVPPKVYREILGPSDLWPKNRISVGPVLTIKVAPWQVDPKIVDPLSQVPETEPLMVSLGQIERFSQFNEPQANGASLTRNEVGYWTTSGSPLADPGKKLLLVQRGKDTWLSFMVYSYSVSITKDSNEAFIQAWGYS